LKGTSVLSTFTPEKISHAILVVAPFALNIQGDEFNTGLAWQEYIYNIHSCLGN
jgi:hypothetical protein